MEEQLTKLTELAERTLSRVNEINGRVKDHELLIRGDPDLGLVGLVEQAKMNTDYRKSISGQLKVWWAVSGSFMTAVLTLLGIILAGHM